MLAILKDAAARPELFGWFGPIASHEIDSWLKQSNLRVPDDLRELWAVTGGGDFFESETLLRPTAVQSSEPYFIESTDFIDLVNQFWNSNGMSTDYLPFHRRAALQSAIRLSDQKIVTLDDEWHLIKAFSDLDEWYLVTLRHDYAEVYNLSDELASGPG